MSNQLYALLIGINSYVPGSRYPSLKGCVRDITAIEAFLKSTLHVPDTQIFKLLASDYVQELELPEETEAAADLPTYERIVAAFQSITARALAGDHIYIHYSGHGGRAKTLYPELKGEHGFDEALVPMNIAHPDARYLRDVELAQLLQFMVDKGLIVTVVLDSCHSGSATRGESQDTVRGQGTVDTASRPTQSLIAPRETLIHTWLHLNAGSTRDLSLGSGWLPEVKDYVLLAACRATEGAYEHYFANVGRHGVLTYWLLDALKQLNSRLTYKQLHEEILAKVHSEFVMQTPQLQGDASRTVFGAQHVQTLYAVNVMYVEPTQKRLLLNTGESQAVHKGAQFMVYPPGTLDFARLDARQALVEISTPGATDSWARVIASFRPEPLLQGAQAVLVNPGSTRLRRTVRLVLQEGLPATIDQKQVLSDVKRAIKQHSSNFVVLADSNDTTDYQVAITMQGTYELWDPAGIPFANIRPALRIEEKGAAEQLARRLTHLAKYRNVLQLDNTDVLSSLAGRLSVELAGIQQEYNPTDRPEPVPFQDPGHTPILKPGEWTFLHIKNAFSQVLNITVLDLGPDWSIRQAYPSRRDTSSMPLDPKAELLIPLRAYLPDGYADAVDVLKVFATLGSTSFRWLELPALDQPYRQDGIRGKPENPLEQLLAIVAAGETQTRRPYPAVYPAAAWSTGMVEVRVQLL